MPIPPDPLAGQVSVTFMTAAGQFLYAANPPSNPSSTVVACWDTNTNAQVWQHLLPASELWAAGLTVDETRGTVYVATAAGSVYAFHLATGAVLWDQSVSGQIGGSCLALWGNDVVVVATQQGELYVVIIAIPGSGGPQRITRAHFTGGGSGLIPVGVAIDSSTGTLACFMELPSGGFSLAAFGLDLNTFQWPWYTTLSPGEGMTFFYAGGGGMFYLQGGNTLYARDALTGTSSWSFQATADISSAVFVPASLAGGSDSVYFGTWDGNLYDIHAGSGIQNWVTPVTVDIPGGTVSTQIAQTILSSSDGQLYFLCYDENLTGFTCAGTIDPAGGGEFSAVAPLWALPSPSAVANGVTACNGVAYVPTGVPGTLNWVDMLNVVNLGWDEGLSVETSATSDEATEFEVTMTLAPQDGVPRASAPVTIWAPEAMTISANGATYTVTSEDRVTLATDGEGVLALMVSAPGLLFASLAATPAGGWINIPVRAGTEASCRPVSREKAQARFSPSARIKQITIESELIVGTYDQSSSTLTPQNAQYQLYLRLVDAFGNPRASYPVTFSSVDTSTITIGGTPYPIGPALTATALTDGGGNLSLIMTAPTRVTLPALTLQCAFMGGGSVTVNVDRTATSGMGAITADQLAPANAVAYDGNPLLTSAYQDEGNRTAIAQAFQNTVGGQQVANALFFAENPFVQTSRANGVQYVPASLASLASATGGWQIGAIPNFSFALSGTSLSFTPLSQEEAQAHVARMAELNIFGDFADFCDNVWNGVESVAQVVASTVAKVTTFVVNTIVDGVEKAYSFVATTLQQAGAAIASFMKTVADDVERFIEFLSYLFDWDDFLLTKDVIKNICSQNLTSFTNWWASASASATLSINGYFAQLAGDISTIESTIAAALTGQGTAGSVNGSMNNPSGQFSGGGARSYAKTQWLSGKIQSGMQTSSAAALALGSGDPYSDLISTFESFFTSTANTLATAVPTLATDVANVFGSFTALMSNPAQFASTGLASIVELLADIAQTLLQVANAAAVGFLNLLSDLLNAVWSILNRPLDIPFVSWLYNLITGSALTLLDGLALLVAIPATIVYKAISSSSSAAGALVASGAGAVNLVHVAYSLGLAVTTLFDGLGSLTGGSEWASPVAGASLALNAVTQLLTVPMKDFGGGDAWQDYLLWSFQCLPLIGGAFDYSTLTGEATEWVTGTWMPNRGQIYCGYGIGMMSAFCIWAQEWPDDYSGTNYTYLIQNLFSVVMYPFRPLEGTPTEEFLTFTTIVGDGVNAGMSFQYLTD